MSTPLSDVPIGIVLKNPSTENDRSILNTGKYQFAMTPVTNENFKRKCLQVQLDSEIHDNPDPLLPNKAELNRQRNLLILKTNQVGKDINSNSRSITVPYPNKDDSDLTLLPHLEKAVGILSTRLDLEESKTLGLY